MKIVSWNWQYIQNIEKYLEILKYDPQVLIVQECTKNDFDYIKNMWKYKNWYNDDLNSEESPLGVAIFSNDYKIEFTDIFNRKYRYVIPYYLSNENYEFTLFSVWIKPFGRDYETPLYEAIKYYRENKMIDNHAIFIGDFNTFAKENNTQLKKLREKFAPMVNCAEKQKIDNRATYFNSHSGFGTDDFCFASEDIAKRIINVSIPPDGWDEKNCWKGLSDHCPISVEFNF